MMEKLFWMDSVEHWNSQTLSLFGKYADLTVNLLVSNIPDILPGGLCAYIKLWVLTSIDYQYISIIYLNIIFEAWLTG